MQSSFLQKIHVDILLFSFSYSVFWAHFPLARYSFNPNRGVWGMIIFSPLPLPPCWFSRNKSKTVKAVTIAFCSIQELFIRDILAKFGIPNLAQSPDVGQNSDGGISNFQISGRSFINENCHKSRIRHDIYMKLGPVTKLDKGNTSTSKIFDDDVMS